MLGNYRMLDARVVRPSDEFFPDKYDQGDAGRSFRTRAQFLCAKMPELRSAKVGMRMNESLAKCRAAPKTD